MMYRIKKHRLKWKRKLLLALYLAFVLALVGEFFYALNDKTTLEKENKAEVRVEVRLPEHIPDEGKIEFIRIEKVYNSSRNFESKEDVESESTLAETRTEEEELAWKI